MKAYPVEIHSEGALVCFTWFERDRKNIRLETEDGDEIFSLWDADVDDAIESGFLSVPRHPRPDDSDWLPHAVEYARQAGMFVVTQRYVEILPSFEVTAAGFDGSTDATDDRVIWVKATDADAVARAVEGTGAGFHRIINGDTDIDYVLPQDELSLRAELIRFQELVTQSGNDFLQRGG